MHQGHHQELTLHLGRVACALCRTKKGERYESEFKGLQLG